MGYFPNYEQSARVLETAKEIEELGWKINITKGRFLEIEHLESGFIQSVGGMGEAYMFAKGFKAGHEW